jgi:hypothetical protein
VIDRYCFIRLADAHATAEGRAEALAVVRRDLASVPGLLRLTVGTPADDSAARWDLSIVARFASLAELTAAMSGPAWAAVLDAWLPARAVVIKSWSFDVDER